MSFALASRVLYTLTIKVIALTSFFYDDPDPGTFGPIMDKISALARDLWGVAVGLIIIAATLAMILSVLKGTGGMLIGGSKETTVAIISIVGIVLLVVVGFVAIPQLAELLKGLQPAAPF